MVTVTGIRAMKDNADKGTGDMFGEKRGRGRPKTGNAKTGAERQAAYRAKQQDNNVTVTINRALVEGLDAQMQAIRDGGPNTRPDGQPFGIGLTPLAPILSLE